MNSGPFKAIFFLWWTYRLCHGFQQGPPRRVFLTGATGFVGSNVARDVLKIDQNVSVVCLVRSKDPEEAAQRLKAAFDKFGLEDYDPRRLQAIPGDVVKPNLGLTQENFDFWAQNSDAVVHCAADIALSKDSEANGANAIENVLSLAAGGSHPSSLHFVSSIAAVASADADTILECGDYPPSASFRGGYGEAKHAAETRIRTWAAENPDKPSYIYRAPFIIGSVAQPRTVPDIFFKLIRVLNVIPQARTYLPLCTVNHLSKVMAHSVLYGDEVLKSGRIQHEKGVPKVLHTVANQQTMAEQADLIREALPTYRDAKMESLPELSCLARADRVTQSCRNSKKACSPVAVGMLGNVLDHNTPFFSSKKTWEFLSECNLNLSIAKLKKRDVQLAFLAATTTLETHDTSAPSQAPFGFSRNTTDGQIILSV